MAYEQGVEKRITRQTKYAVVRVEQLRAVNPRDDAEVAAAANSLPDDLISSLEELVNAAKAGRLEGENALALAAAAWPAEQIGL